MQITRSTIFITSETEKNKNLCEVTLLTKEKVVDVIGINVILSAVLVFVVLAKQVLLIAGKEAGQHLLSHNC